MDNSQDSNPTVPPNPEYNMEPSPEGKGCVVQSFYSLRNTRFLPHLINSNGNHSDRRKKVTVTMEEKLRALQRLDAGEPARIIAEELGVGKSTISDWKKHRTEIERWYANQAGGSCIKARKTMRKGKHALVERALYHWFEFVRSRGFQVSGPLLQQKALQFKDKIEGVESERFSASEGWLDRWKKRFGIGNLLSTGTSIPENEDDSLLDEMKRDFFEFDDIRGEQLYSCGRTVLNYRILPSNLLGSKGCEVTEYESSQESVMVLACSNATGNHKLRLSFIGKSEKFQEFESVKGNELLPFWYSSQSDVWLDGNVLKIWFESEFVPAVEKYLSAKQLPRKAVLLVTNYPSFANLCGLRDGDIRVVFIPVQAAPQLQAMDRGILESFKKKYWCRLLNSIISRSTDSENCLKTLRNVDVLEAIQFTIEAWEDIPSSTFSHSWKHIIDQTGGRDWAESENEVLSRANDDKEIVNLLQKISCSDDVSLQDVSDWLLNEEDEEIVSDDIVAMIVKEPQSDLEVSEENLVNDEEPSQETVEIKAELSGLDGDSCAENIPPQFRCVRHSEGLKAITKALEYVSQQAEATPEDIVFLLKWRDIAATKTLQEEKPKKSAKKPKLF